jgi:hypothetical protein
MINDGGQAFPIISGEGWGCSSGGMTLRDYFAGRNMPTLLKMAWQIYKDCLGKSDEENFDKGGVWIKIAAELSYKAADAMLVEREKGE